jgi:hypothetical protein
MKKIKLTKQSDAVREMTETYIIEWDTPSGITAHTSRNTLEEAEKVFYQIKELNGDTLVSEELRFEDIG